jgi:hypothetical protein
MLRLETDNGWLLFTHPEHARVAAVFAEHWRNQRFVPPEPFPSVLTAVAHHDDSWARPDSQPSIVGDGTPGAFSRELVNTYDAFENVDLEAYLEVRGNATENIAERDPFAAVVISMHTVNLLTEQADLSGLSEEERAVHSRFIDGQRKRQEELKAACAESEGLKAFTDQAYFDRAFEFLQACDNLSLFLCVDFPSAMQLRHTHPTVDGERHAITVRPEGEGQYSLHPFPFDGERLTVTLHGRELDQKTFASNEALREAWKNAPRRAIDASLLPAEALHASAG